MLNYQYVGDDGQTYQITQPDSYSAAGAGNLPPAGGSEFLWLPLWTVRYMLCFDTLNPAAPFLKIVCDADNANWILGPGTQFSVDIRTVQIVACKGEQRPSF